MTVLVLGHAVACGNHSATRPNAPVADAAPEDVSIPYDGLPQREAGPRTPVHAEFTSTPIRTDTMQLMFAAGEMQTSGEPFASNFAGRVLYYYIRSRYATTPDQYYVPCGGINSGFCLPTPVIDLFGFSTAVESYEYSKYHMNMVANQGGAGVSLVNGPLLAPLAGATPFDKLRSRMQTLIAASGADAAKYATIPAPTKNISNDFGFPGLWPNMGPFRSFDVTMAPSMSAVVNCTNGGSHGYGGLAQFGNSAVALYECDYNSLRLTNRSSAEHVVGPGILGYSTWKEALWAIDFTGRLHDSQANFVTMVAPQDVPAVGQLGNMVQAMDPGAAPGVFIGSTPLEGMWGLTMVEEMDNSAAWLLASLMTGDGAALTGLPSVLAAIQYDYGSPLLWFPTAISVTETTSGGNGGPYDRYPLVSALAIEDATSRSVDLAALAQGYSLFFGMTDARNVAVGQQTGMQIAFGGNSIFAGDNGVPDGENSPHDRALGVMRVAFVDLDRLHVDPATRIVVDTATVGTAGVTRGTTVTTTSLGHVVVGLRHLLMACNAAVSQYGAPDPDPSKDTLGVLNAIPIHPPDLDAGSPQSFSARVRAVLKDQAQFVLSTLTGSDGTVRNSATLSSGQWSASTDATTLDAQSAALRVLVEAWFLTHEPAYQLRARAVARILLTKFWSEPARMFRGLAGGADDVVMTPEGFGWLQQALRETYEALWIPGDPLLDRPLLEDRIARVNKLYLNGWDDLDGNQLVDKPTECLDARLQLGEQALTGEIANNSNSFPQLAGEDRESDCVRNIAFSNTASVLAGEVHFHSP
jgi:hypothetical protein